MRKRRKPIAIDVPEGDGAGGPDAESRAVAADLAYRALLEESRRRSAAGDRGRPAEDVFRELGLADGGDGGPAPAAPAAPAAPSASTGGGGNGSADGPTRSPKGGGVADQTKFSGRPRGR